MLNQVPVEELVSGMVSHLPLKEDLEEYELVFKAFLTLYSAGHSVTPQCIPKIVESAAHFTTAHNVDKTKVGGQLANGSKNLNFRHEHYFYYPLY